MGLSSEDRGRIIRDLEYVAGRIAEASQGGDLNRQVKSPDYINPSSYLPAVPLHDLRGEFAYQVRMFGFLRDALEDMPISPDVENFRAPKYLTDLII